MIYLQRNQKQESISTFQNALELWKALHDRENQADILLRIGEVYRYMVAMDGMTNNSKVGLQYYQQANELLKPLGTQTVILTPSNPLRIDSVHLPLYSAPGLSMSKTLIVPELYSDTPLGRVFA